MESSNFHVLTFDLGEENFLLGLMQIQEVIRRLHITKVPNSPHFIEGVINLRGKIVPIIDLRKRFGIELKEVNNNLERIIVIEFRNGQVGLMVDSVREVLKIETEKFEETPEIISRIDEKFVKGMAKYQGKIYIFLDIENILGLLA